LQKEENETNTRRHPSYYGVGSAPLHMEDKETDFASAPLHKNREAERGPRLKLKESGAGAGQVTRSGTSTSTPAFWVCVWSRRR